MCNLFYIFEDFSNQIQSDINSIYEKVLPEY